MTGIADQHASPNMPRTGNVFTRWLGRMILSIVGWKISGELPNEKKLIIVGAPHTSNMDFVLAMGSMLAIGLKFSWMMEEGSVLLSVCRIVEIPGRRAG